MRSLVKVRLAEARRTALSLSREIGVSKWCTDRGIAGMTLRRAEQVALALGCRVSDLYEE